MSDFYDYRNCPSCGRSVNMYGAKQCQSCTPRKEWKKKCSYHEYRTKAEILSDFYKNGFQ